jgi:hypothetical protein
MDMISLQGKPFLWEKSGWIKSRCDEPMKKHKK